MISMWVDGQFHSYIKKKSLAAAINVAKKKSALYGSEHFVALYNENGKFIGEYWNGYTNYSAMPENGGH